MRVAKPRDWVPIGSPCTYAASAGISAAGRSQQPSPLLATPSPGATSRGTTATRPPTRSRTRPPSSHSPPRPMPTPSRTPRPGSQRCPTTRSPTRAEGSSGHGNGAGASRSRTNPGPAQAVTPGPAGLDTNSYAFGANWGIKDDLLATSHALETKLATQANRPSFHHRSQIVGFGSGALKDAQSPRCLDQGGSAWCPCYP